MSHLMSAFEAEGREVQAATVLFYWEIPFPLQSHWLEVSLMATLSCKGDI